MWFDFGWGDGGVSCEGAVLTVISREIDECTDLYCGMSFGGFFDDCVCVGGWSSSRRSDDVRMFTLFLAITLSATLNSLLQRFLSYLFRVSSFRLRVFFSHFIMNNSQNTSQSFKITIFLNCFL